MTIEKFGTAPDGLPEQPKEDTTAETLKDTFSSQMEAVQKISPDTLKLRNEIKDYLSNFHGSDEWYKIYPNVHATEGIKYLADKAECYWLLDIVYSCQFDKKVKQEPFQTYELETNLGTGTAKLTVHDGNYKTLYEQEIPLTNFPLEKITLYYTNNVVMLPSEY